MTQTRPLSPHLQIYRWTLTMALSILHRATGVALYGGTFLLTAWLAALALGAEAYHYIHAFIATPWGQLILFLYSWALLHHLFGGLRHFVWDIGAGFDLRYVQWLAWGSALLPLICTLALWGWQLL